MNYSPDDILKFGKTFSERNPITGDVWLHRDDPFSNYDEFYRILKGLDMKEGDKVLYVGTGSGYGTYVFSNIVGSQGEVHSYEIDEKNMRIAKGNLERGDHPRNINVILGDGLNQHRENYFDKVMLAAAGRLEINDVEKQVIAKNDLGNGLLKHLSRIAKIGGNIILPMGKLEYILEPVCYGNIFKVKNLEDKLSISKIDSDYKKWSILTGEHGFSKEEIEKVSSDRPLWDMELLS